MVVPLAVCSDEPSEETTNLDVMSFQSGLIGNDDAHEVQDIYDSVPNSSVS